VRPGLYAVNPLQKQGKQNNKFCVAVKVYPDDSFFYLMRVSMAKLVLALSVEFQPGTVFLVSISDYLE